MIVDREQARCLYLTSYLSLLSLTYAIYRNHYNLAIIPGAVFLTSINYWRTPTYSFIRNLDIAVVITSAVYQTYIAYYSQYGNLYHLTTAASGLLYLLGIYYHRKQELWKGTYAHMSLHVMANIGNIVLYSGYTK